MFKLRFKEAQLPAWAERYSYRANDRELRGPLRHAVLARGFLERAEFLRICHWKTVRSRSRCEQNSGFHIKTITRASFSSGDETIKMDLLRTLSGVEWPTASTLLHFCDRRPYPILDYRALWSLGIDKPPHYDMPFWLEYLAFSRRLAGRTGLEIRDVDRALWQYSKENQGRE